MTRLQCGDRGAYVGHDGRHPCVVVHVWLDGLVNVKLDANGWEYGGVAVSTQPGPGQQHVFVPFEAPTRG